MFKFLLVLIFSAYSASPLAFWVGAIVISFSALTLLLLLGLCRVAGEADDWADDRLTEFRASGT